MKIKLDENLGNRGAEILRAEGYSVTTVVEKGLSSASDDRLIEICRKVDVRQRARNFTKLLPGASADDAPRSKEWRLFVNASIEADA